MREGNALQVFYDEKLVGTLSYVIFFSILYIYKINEKEIKHMMHNIGPFHVNGNVLTKHGRTVGEPAMLIMRTEDFCVPVKIGSHNSCHEYC